MQEEMKLVVGERESSVALVKAVKVQVEAEVEGPGTQEGDSDG